VHEPVAPSFSGHPSPAPVAFQSVSEHEDSIAEPHRPSRRRRHESGDTASQQQELQLVETQAEAPASVVEDDQPRRTKPRRRRGGPAEAEPLQLVETQPTGEPQRPEGMPTP
jgi:hypothetical protein